ncbi:MAG: ABC transporter ATP-binding protein, partial [Dehalococcoidia bacterium]|nr:ABC transporter ATP-binding protein [Dehalococcoidia bacterium]
MWRNAVEAIAEAGDERARSRGAVARRLAGELARYRLGIAALLVLTVVNSLAQAVGPWLVGLAIDDVIALRDPVRLAWIMVALLASYVAGYLAA